MTLLLLHFSNLVLTSSMVYDKIELTCKTFFSLGRLRGRNRPVVKNRKLLKFNQKHFIEVRKKLSVIISKYTDKMESFFSVIDCFDIISEQMV